ncbi:3-hydroxyacyl-CoA dehydrogenase/enoyl-CoA hydratase family protein [Marivirga harenae]|uniref:3-hydroxyacyl-CoA dehydrogenase/enoyl-CoA hydratase family protein n=1 Tax=Marivirga harenae TaxID=2010992 RepID=UPI0026DFF5B0|nr:3-hydroxyacyl-CoA dehydrogenase/enoyl-CoA hydratase family protein [Marivirga harenae]WKV12664.1 3-hydroxyacyl-CoA dehydrogenase/enoyl-CoA hydratase family protein [Marivirga harenae]|tara:strand:+ start:25186 stop:27588 length:2403 start_codon:yes stop_codon:yes gene_type:complete
MKRNIKKVAVLGSGIMGSRIACHFANIGVEVLLLDIVPFELTDAEKDKGLTKEDPQVRNRIVNEAFESTLKGKPASLYHKDFANRISLGNFDDDMHKIKDCDWVLEAVVERLDIKKKVFSKVEEHRTKGTIISSNTSGIPIHMMLEERSEDFQKHFIGTHFFNPPRYLKLLEIIPTPKTDQAITDFLMHYGDLYLGKTTVLCKDTPAFIANRVGIYAILKVVESMQKLGMNIDEIDKLTGPVIGRPKSATFRTSDVVGLDTLIKVANGLYENLPNDEARETFNLPDVIGKLEDNKWLGDKTGQGFYKKTKKDGKTEILTLDLESMEYKPKSKPKFSTLESTKQISNLKERFPVLLGGKDKAGEFYRDSFYGLFKYASNRIPEISDELYRIDQAVCTGFGWEIGPFETWDTLGVKKTVEKMEEAGYKPNQWVYDMLDSGADSFYKVEAGQKQYYDLDSKKYVNIPGTEEFIILENLKESGKEIWSNAEAGIIDLGDGIINVEFRSKSNSLGGGVIEAINKAISMGEEKYRGVVISNEGSNFSVGANLGMIFMYAIEQDYDELDFMIRQFQQTMMRARYSAVPVVVAPHNMALGGGCELSMHADHVQASAETYIGLVEVGVGVIPGGGGTKENALRVADRYQDGDVELNALQNAYMNIAMAKVATSAHEARDMGILRPSDGISMNRSRQIADAKAAAIRLADAGYTMPVQRTDIKVQGKTGIALFKAGVSGMKMGRYISEHDQKIADKLAYVMCGGDLSYPQEVSEQYLLDLEREAFLSLLGEKKTLERIQAVLQGGKPLRN